VLARLTFLAVGAGSAELTIDDTPPFAPEVSGGGRVLPVTVAGARLQMI
jgi:hypothetical protein